jgi:hypothetical protein
MVVETFGAWDPSARVALDKIADKYALHQGVAPAKAASWLFTRLSVTLMRMNARMLLVRSTVGGVDEVPIEEAWHPADEYAEDDVWEDPLQWAEGVDRDEDVIRF